MLFVVIKTDIGNQYVVDAQARRYFTLNNISEEARPALLLDHLEAVVKWGGKIIKTRAPCWEANQHYRL